MHSYLVGYFMVGYFIGDAPHVGSIHASVNCIQSSPNDDTKIDVQFSEKKTVLFRIENSQMRARVNQCKYWHIADVPLVVNVWTPESDFYPLDLSASCGLIFEEYQTISIRIRA